MNDIITIAPSTNAGATSQAPSAKLEFTVWRMFAWCGPIYMTVGLVAFAGIAHFLPPPRQNWGADHLAYWFIDNSTRVKLGMLGMLAIGFFYAAWSLAVARLMERVEGPHRLLSRIQLLGGVGTALVTMGCAIPWFLAAFRPGSRTPSEILLLSDMGWSIFDLTAMVTIVQMLSFGLLWLLVPETSQLVPRWMSYFSFFITTLQVPVYVWPWVTSGPFAWSGLIDYYVLLAAFFGWIVVVTYHLLRAIAQLERSEMAL
jgi:hypothetical protein